MFIKKSATEQLLLTHFSQNTHMGWPGISTGLRGERLTANHPCHDKGFFKYLTMQYALSSQSSSTIRENISFWKVSMDVVVNSNT